MNIRQALESWAHYHEDSSIHLEFRKLTDKLWIVTNRHYEIEILTTDPDIYHDKDFKKQRYHAGSRPLGGG